jgi:type IV pilus assembly protein PilN
MSMIHINLLPVRQVKKREVGRQWLVLAGALLVLAVILNFFWWEARQSVSDKNQQRIAATQQRINDLEKILSEVNNINKHRNEVEDKLKQLEDRRKSKSGPVRMMDALSVATPKKVWLAGFTEAAEKVDLKGQAVSHEDVAEFMRNLQAVVWTPRGMGRLIEQKRDGKSSRVELLAFDGAVEDFSNTDVKNFFTEVQLSDAAQGKGSGKNDERVVNFNIKFKAHYAI